MLSSLHQGKHGIGVDSQYMRRHKVNFAPNQKLPPGYSVEWFESDEMYHWVISDDLYSVCCCCRWMAYRGAWANYKATSD